ncbi:MAG: DUF1735 domain-containing protein [Bacteroidetes bacterium]|nr:DUF1735 domain-containing protein [Bacteroidota bacterium]MBS1539594.1 DUF1735 domain-containing protein [Bacteroidota bacterium]
MKLLNMKIFAQVALVGLLLLAACQGNQMNTPPGATSPVISVAVNSIGTWQATPLAVDASASQVEYNLILVVLSSSGGPAKQDVHVTMVPATDSLASYNAATGNNYVMPGGPGTPAFTLVDGGVVTIPKGSNIGYLKIQTTSADYFGATSYAFAYRISSVQESGYVISANNGYNITPFIPKNQYDGVYDLSLNTTGWGAYGIADDNVFRDYGNVALSTISLTSCSFLNLVRGDNLQPGFTSAGGATGFGAASPNFVFDSSNKLVNVYNAIPPDTRNRTFSINPAATSSENLYDPASKKIVANYLFHQNGRPDMVVKAVLTYVGSR